MDGEYWQRDDLLARLRMEASINQGNAKLCGEAADEIERLRITPDEQAALVSAIGYHVFDGQAKTLERMMERIFPDHEEQSK